MMRNKFTDPLAQTLCTMYKIDGRNTLCFWVHGTISQQRSVERVHQTAHTGHGRGWLTHQSKPIQDKPCLSWCSSQQAEAKLRASKDLILHKGPISTLVKH